jgi:hypothetical protein
MAGFGFGGFSSRLLRASEQSVKKRFSHARQRTPTAAKRELYLRSGLVAGAP